METIPTPNSNEKRGFNSKEDAIQKFFLENEIDKLNFDTREEAQAHVDKINREYGDISFVAEDRGGFAVKFKADHLAHGLEEFKPKDEEDNSFSDLEEAA